MIECTVKAFLKADPISFLSTNSGAHNPPLFSPATTANVAEKRKRRCRFLSLPFFEAARNLCVVGTSVEAGVLELGCGLPSFPG